MSHNQIERLPVSINKLSKLKQLHLHNNRLLEIPHIILQTIDRKFDISHNQLTSLPPITLHTSQLLDVYLNNNPITTLPEGFKNHQTIKHIDIKNTKISAIPEFISTFKKLRKFQTKNSLLETFPESFLPILKEPVLTGKKLQVLQDFSFPNSLEKEYKRKLWKKYFENLTPQKAKVVTTLHLSDHDFTELPEQIGDLYNLHRLNVAKNKLTTLPQSMRNLTSLKRIHVSSTALTDLSPLEDLPLLLEIYAKDNCLTQFIPNHKFQNLQMLNLSKNRLTSLPHSLDKLQKLTALRLNVNQISFMHDSEQNTFQSLEDLRLPKGLTCINLGENPITILPNALFESTSLEEIYASKTSNQQQNEEPLKSYKQNADWFWIESN